MTRFIEPQSDKATSSEDKLALYKRGETSYIDLVVKQDGQLVTELCKESIQPYLDEGYELMPFDQMVELILQANIDRFVTDWEEISEEQYWFYLEVLPPEKWEGHMFRMREHTALNITRHVAKYGEKYFTANKIVTSDYSEYWKEIYQLASQKP